MTNKKCHIIRCGSERAEVFVDEKWWCKAHAPSPRFSISKERCAELAKLEEGCEVGVAGGASNTPRNSESNGCPRCTGAQAPCDCDCPEAACDCADFETCTACEGLNAGCNCSDWETCEVCCG